MCCVEGMVMMVVVEFLGGRGVGDERRNWGRGVRTFGDAAWGSLLTSG